MSSDELDEIDRGILHLLQQDARNCSAADIAEKVVSPLIQFGTELTVSKNWMSLRGTFHSLITNRQDFSSRS